MIEKEEEKNIDFHERVKNIFKLLKENEINFKTNKKFKKELEKASEVYTNEEGIKGRFIPFESLVVLTRDLHPIVRPDGTIMVRCYKDEVLKKIPIQEEDEEKRAKTYINKNGNETYCGRTDEEDEEIYTGSSHDETNINNKDNEEEETYTQGNVKTDKEVEKKKVTTIKKDISMGILNNSGYIGEDDDISIADEIDGVEIDSDEVLRAERNNFTYIEDCKSKIINEEVLRCVFKDDKKTEIVMRNYFADRKVYKDQNYNYYIEQDNFLQTLYKTVNAEEKKGKIYFEFKVLNSFLEKECGNIFKIVKKKISFDGNAEGRWKYLYAIDKEYIQNVLNMDENSTKRIVTPIRVN